LAHDVGLAVVAAETHHRDVLTLGVAGDRGAEPIADALKDRRRGDGVAQVRREERHHLPADLQVRDVGVEVDPVQTTSIRTWRSEAGLTGWSLPRSSRSWWALPGSLTRHAAEAAVDRLTREAGAGVLDFGDDVAAGELSGAGALLESSDGFEDRVPAARPGVGELGLQWRDGDARSVDGVVAVRIV
jgi:hypothetical protein